MAYMSVQQTEFAPRERAIGEPPTAFTCTETMVLAALDYLISMARPLPPAAAALAPVGGVPYLEWLFTRLCDRLPADERAILVGLLRGEKRAAIGDRLGRNRNWVAERMRTRLAPQLVALINAAVAFPCFSHQAMLGVKP